MGLGLLRREGGGRGGGEEEGKRFFCISKTSGYSHIINECMYFSAYKCLHPPMCLHTHTSPGTRPSKNRKGESGKSAGVKVYTVPSMQAHFRLAFD